VLIATGSRAIFPDIPGASMLSTSDYMFHLARVPERMVVVGGGYIAVEFAGIFRGLGAQVTQIHRGPLFLRGFDIDLRRSLADEMAKKGVELRFGQVVTKLVRGARGLEVHASDGSVLESDLVLFATGRVPRTRELDLAAAGVRLRANGAIAVDEYSRTSCPSVHAIGDVTDRINLTPVAIGEAEALARTLFAGKPTPVDHANVPSAVFSQPALGSVGLSEEAALAQYGEIDVYRTSFRSLRHTLSGNEERSMMKLVVDRASDRVLGVHVLSPDAPEIVQGFAVAVKLGATKAQFDATTGIHPTAAEELVTLREKLPDSARTPLPEAPRS
jgi:glutathione reductase (NADPH)